MASTKRRYSKEEFARRGDAIYEKDVRPQLKADDTVSLRRSTSKAESLRLMPMS